MPLSNKPPTAAEMERMTDESQLPGTEVAPDPDAPEDRLILEARADALTEAARGHKITDDVTRAMASEMRSQMKTAMGQLEKYRTWHVKPLNAHVKRINDSVRPAKTLLEAGIEMIDKEMTRDYDAREALAKQRREAAEAQARKERDEAARAAAERAEREAEAAGNFTEQETQEYAKSAAVEAKETVVIPVVTVHPPPAQTVHAASGGRTTFKKILDYELVDVAALAAALPGAIEVKRNAVLAYGRGLEAQGKPLELPGVRYFRKTSPTGS